MFLDLLANEKETKFDLHIQYLIHLFQLILKCSDCIRKDDCRIQ